MYVVCTACMTFKCMYVCMYGRLYHVTSIATSFYSYSVTAMAIGNRLPKESGEV